MIDEPGNSVFQLHARLARDGFVLGYLSLCQLLLMNDSRFPWFILVPQRPGVSEIYQLAPADRQLLLEESCHLAACLAESFHADKINIGSLGNVVPQLHLHHVVRYHNDAAWPGPVWGYGEAVPYTDELLLATLRRVQGKLPGWVESTSVARGIV